MSSSEQCARCGTALLAGAKFCGRCGEPISAQPAESMPSTASVPALPRSASPPAGSRSSLQNLLIAFVAVLLLVGSALIGAALLGGEASDVGAAPGPETAGADAEVGAQTAQEDGSDSEPEQQIQCWNGSKRETHAQCPPLRGIAGMRWLFPSLAEDFSRCSPGAAYDGKVRALGCAVDSEGHSARVVYSEWSTFGSGDRHYRRKYGTPDRSDGQFNVWSTVWVSNNFQTSRMFSSRLPFSVTVASESEDGATAVMDGLRFRPEMETARY